MRVVVDTNVLVSAAIKNREPEAVLLFIIERPDFEWIVSREILHEYQEVLARPKFGLQPDLLDRWRGVVEHVTTVVDAEAVVAFPPDSADAIFLSCALAATADFLISGDRQVQTAKTLSSTRIVSVAQFKSLVCDTLASQ